jgi:hypothetical protein
VDGGVGLQMWKVAANILDRPLWTADKWWSSSFWRLGETLTTLHLKKKSYYEMLHKVSDMDGFFGTTWAMENGYEVWNMEC